MLHFASDWLLFVTLFWIVRGGGSWPPCPTCSCCRQGTHGRMRVFVVSSEMMLFVFHFLFRSIFFAFIIVKIDSREQLLCGRLRHLDALAFFPTCFFDGYTSCRWHQSPRLPRGRCLKLLILCISQWSVC